MVFILILIYLVLIVCLNLNLLILLVKTNIMLKRFVMKLSVKNQSLIVKMPNLSFVLKLKLKRRPKLKNKNKILRLKLNPVDQHSLFDLPRNPVLTATSIETYDFCLNPLPCVSCATPTHNLALCGNCAAYFLKPRQKDTLNN